ncbi:hypothetical protein CMK13_01325 [Candidatus Poribacteria bacterium]|jgi:hypothetical protein|nr:hypothetical protein [Candidatus Poribacteria bacterium]MBF75896.1 hypothetical protein [Candidatus Poribacteria bacterium]MCH2573591.1 hypothetical protein [Candidatus Poribacteria bacterium]OUT67503.1 MAG: hypothetical protein CBB75_01115 [bacterium TMED15]|tara:strand:+ start:10914 stop:11552 length:639 start_codon:yes stop_codon:yes gene_type:complete
MLQVNTWYYRFLIALSIILLVSCQSKETPKELTNTSIQSQPSSNTSQVQKGNTSQVPKSNNLNYTAASGWIRQQPSSSMRHDQYELPGPKGVEAATLAIFKGIGGSISSNIDRWKKQFVVPPNGSDPDSVRKESKVINQIPVHIVAVQGTYLKPQMPMMMDGPKVELKNYALLAAIAETKDGLWFFKITGPEKTVMMWQNDFDNFIGTFRLN